MRVTWNPLCTAEQGHRPILSTNLRTKRPYKHWGRPDQILVKDVLSARDEERTPGRVIVAATITCPSFGTGRIPASRSLPMTLEAGVFLTFRNNLDKFGRNSAESAGLDSTI